MVFQSPESRPPAADPLFRATHHGVWRQDFQPSPVLMVIGSRFIKIRYRPISTATRW
ncbi:MAG: hypothetical protein ACO3GO_00675 [Terrimicrobiaceae bacterium]